MADVAQFRSELETLAAEYPNSLDSGATGRILLPHMLLAFMLLAVLDKLDEISQKIEDDDD